MIRYSIGIIGLFAFFSSTGTVAQSLQIGGGIGFSSYYGDLNDELLRLEEVRPGGSIYIKWSPSWFNLRGGVSYTQITSADAHSNNPLLYQRNLSFRSQIMEAQLAVELDLLSLERGAAITPYLLAGIVYFHFDPEAEYQGTWYKLQPLSTEGQGLPYFNGNDPYQLNQLGELIGGGVKWNLGPQLILGFETGFRRATTDYLDDVSNVYVDEDLLIVQRGEVAAALSDRSAEIPENPVQDHVVGEARGNADNNDWYQLTTFTLSYRFARIGHRPRSKSKYNKVGCPSRF